MVAPHGWQTLDSPQGTQHDLLTGKVVSTEPTTHCTPLENVGKVSFLDNGYGRCEFNRQALLATASFCRPMIMGQHPVTTSPRMRRWTTRAIGPIEALPRVLVVDDERNAADALSAWLALHGYETRVAYGVWGAFTQMDNWTPEVIVLDISMPDYDGFVTAGALRRSAKTATAVILAYTALMEEHIEERDHAGYFDAYCQKGALDELLWLLKSAVISK